MKLDKNPKSDKPWFKRPAIIITLIIVVFIIYAAISGSDSDSETLTETREESTQVDSSENNDGAGQVEDTSTEPTEDPVDESSSLTGPQRNAVRSAESYLRMTGFSRQGLIDQLSSEYGDNYEVEDATVAVDSLSTDYNEQARRSGESYLDMTGFSCQGLIDQLSSDYGDKYTPEQAEAGARAAGAC